MNLPQRLQSLAPAIKNICAISGTPGASIGVIHEGTVVYKESFGYQDIEKSQEVNEDTVFHIMSMSKAFTASALGIAVEEGLLSWDTLLVDILPEFKHPNLTVREKTNVIDLMAHRTGLASSNTVWMQEFGRLSLAKSDTLATFNTLQPVANFRSRFIYSNWGAAIVALMLEKVSNQTWGEFLRTRLFTPLGLDRTSTTRNPNFDNVARGYMALGDASVIENERPHVEDGQIMAGAGSVQSSVNGLLTWYKALLDAASDQIKHGTTSTDGSPFKQLTTVFKPHIPLSDEDISKQAYALGWAHTELPGTLGQIGLNRMYIDKMPIVGKGGEKTLVWHHNGSLAAFLSSVHLLPESRSIIVVLTNSISNNDAADWIGQMLLEALIDNPEKNDYEAFAKISAERCTSQWREIPEKLKKDQVLNTSHKALESYTGKFYNAAGNWFMEVFTKDGVLQFCIQGQHTETYILTHYYHDNFTFILTQEENAGRGRFPLTNPQLYVLRFQAHGDSIYGVLWFQDPDIPEGDLFVRNGAQLPANVGSVKQFNAMRAGAQKNISVDA